MTNASKTQQALALIAQGVPPRKAAQDVGLQPNGVYVALKRQREREAGLCPCCGQPLPQHGQKENSARLLTKPPQ